LPYEESIKIDKKSFIASSLEEAIKNEESIKIDKK